MYRPLAAALLLTSLPLAPAHAAESYDNCTGFIDTVPAVITTQGTWCLRQDLSSALDAGNLIKVETNNVTIDCNGFKIGGLAAGPTSSAAAIGAYLRTNVTVRDCRIRGFGRGISIEGVDGALVEDNIVEGSHSFGILTSGSSCIIRRNHVMDTDSTISEYGGAAIYGNCDILDNTVNYVLGDLARGIDLFNARGRTVQGNRIVGVDGGSVTHGIVVRSSGGAIVRDNHVRGRDGVGIQCYDGTPVAMGNVVGGFTTGVAALCQDEGNVVLP